MNSGLGFDDGSPYLSGVNWGWPDTVKVHRLANIVGDRIKVGEHSRIDAFTTITGNVTIGARVHISTGACIFGTDGVTIGDGCSLSPGAKIFTATDDIRSDLLSGPQLAERYAKRKSVKIGAFSVIGANSVVLPGAEIGDEVQIGSLAVVRSIIADGEVWIGAPAHFLCKRVKVDRAKMMGAIPANTGA